MLKKLLETLSLCAIVSDSWCHKGPLQAITHALAHTVQEKALARSQGSGYCSLYLEIAGINFVLTRVRSIWKTIDQLQPLATNRWIGWSHLQSTEITKPTVISKEGVLNYQSTYPAPEGDSLTVKLFLFLMHCCFSRHFIFLYFSCTKLHLN